MKVQKWGVLVFWVFKVFGVFTVGSRGWLGLILGLADQDDPKCNMRFDSDILSKKMLKTAEKLKLDKNKVNK